MDQAAYLSDVFVEVKMIQVTGNGLIVDVASQVAIMAGNSPPLGGRRL